jgi:hypothetical protein
VYASKRLNSDRGIRLEGAHDGELHSLGGGMCNSASASRRPAFSLKIAGIGGIVAGALPAAAAGLDS